MILHRCKWEQNLATVCIAAQLPSSLVPLDCFPICWAVGLRWPLRSYPQIPSPALKLGQCEIQLDL